MTAATPEPASVPAAAEPAPAAPAVTVRYEWGPKVPTAVKPIAKPGVKPDANVIYHSYDDGHDAATGEFHPVHHLQLLAHDPANENVPAAAHMVLYGPGQAVHSTPGAAVSAFAGGDHLGTTVPVTVTDPTQPTMVSLVEPAGAKSNTEYVAYTVLEFHDAAPEPAPAPEATPAA